MLEKHNIALIVLYCLVVNNYNSKNAMLRYNPLKSELGPKVHGALPPTSSGLLCCATYARTPLDLPEGLKWDLICPTDLQHFPYLIFLRIHISKPLRCGCGEIRSVGQTTGPNDDILDIVGLAGNKLTVITI